MRDAAQQPASRRKDLMEARERQAARGVNDIGVLQWLYWSRLRSRIFVLDPLVRALHRPGDCCAVQELIACCARQEVIAC
jgi:hypothetical protein